MADVQIGRTLRHRLFQMGRRLGVSPLLMETARIVKVRYRRALVQGESPEETLLRFRRMIRGPFEDGHVDFQDIVARSEQPGVLEALASLCVIAASHENQ